MKIILFSRILYKIIEKWNFLYFSVILTIIELMVYQVTNLQNLDFCLFNVYVIFPVYIIYHFLKIIAFSSNHFLHLTGKWNKKNVLHIINFFRSHNFPLLNFKKLGYEKHNLMYLIHKIFYSKYPDEFEA